MSKESAKKFTASITGKVVATRRAGTSSAGNGSYWVTIVTDQGYGEIYRTATNSAISYEITNPEFRNQAHEFELSRAGRLTGRYRTA